MRIGTIDYGFDIEKAANLLNVGRLTEEKCRNCWAIRHCSICAAQIDDGQGLSPTRKEARCQEVLTQVERKLREIILLREVRTIYKDHVNWEGKMHEAI